MNKNIINVLTFDIEDYFQVSAFEHVVERDNWGKFPSRVRQNTQKILELLASKNITATFFILGWVAERYPEIVVDINNYNHEIACHGFSHKLVYKQTQNEFVEETKRSKSLLEDITGKSVLGYRAASYSITKTSLWAIDCLIELGFEYDSSVFPIRHDRYGIVEAPRFPHILKRDNGSILEFPISTASLLGLNLPVSGGGYFRLFPYGLTKYALGKINTMEGKPFIFYLHPWEIDPEQPRINAGFLSNFRHYNNLSKCHERLDKLTKDFQFTTAAEVLDKWDDEINITTY